MAHILPLISLAQIACMLLAWNCAHLQGLQQPEALSWLLYAAADSMLTTSQTFADADCLLKTS